MAFKVNATTVFDNAGHMPFSDITISAGPIKTLTVTKTGDNTVPNGTVSSAANGVSFNTSTDVLTINYATDCANCANCSDCSACGFCFPEGSMVLMADGSLKEISQVVTGDIIWTHMGPSRVFFVKETTLGTRHLCKTHDKSLFWTDDHAIYARQGSEEYLYSVDKHGTQLAMISHGFYGLDDHNKLLFGQDIEFYHQTGWKKVDVFTTQDMSPDTKVYMCFPENHGLVLVNGYLVSAAIDEQKVNYRNIDLQMAFAS